MLAEVKAGELPQRQVFKLHVTDPEEQARLAAKTPRKAPKAASWQCLDLTPQYNGDVRTIFKQQYLSPRPKTCSVRLGVDGYSGWCFAWWGTPVPAIDLSNLQKLSDSQGRILTPQNVPFTRFAEAKNIAFTSLWDNWPRSVTRAGGPTGGSRVAAGLRVDQPHADANCQRRGPVPLCRRPGGEAGVGAAAEFLVPLPVVGGVAIFTVLQL